MTADRWAELQRRLECQWSMILLSEAVPEISRLRDDKCRLLMALKQALSALTIPGVCVDTDSIRATIAKVEKE